MSSFSQYLNPFVYWAQNDQQIFLKVDLKDVKEPKISLKNTEIHFQTNGIGARGQNEYAFNLSFYAPIDTEVSTFTVLDSKVDLILKKQDINWWPRLTAQPQKPHWLKIDFDRWRTEDDADDGDESSYKARNIMQDYPGIMDQLETEEYGYRRERGREVYLIFYNLSQFIGFLYILLVISIRYSRDGVDSIPGTYDAVGNAFKFCQLMQYLETMHPMFGYTKGSILMPFLQVTARVFILLVMIDMEIRMQTKPVVFYLFITWALVEIIRYPYYIMTLINKNYNLLTWLRYTIWIPLYPLGVLCEGIIIIRNIPYFEETRRFTINLPNSFNFTFHMPTFMKIYLLFLILPGVFFMMDHMLKVRNKKLGTKKNWKNN